MAIIHKLTKAQQRKFTKFIATLPPAVRATCEAFPPTKLYLLKTTGQRVTIEAYSDAGTVTVAVTGEYNSVMFDRNVFGIDPADLEECDLPPPDAILGTQLAPDEVYDHIDELRVAIRPDLFVMGPDGKAVRKSH